MNRTQELTKNTFIISLGKISTQLVTFFLLPLYTSLLSKNEYGIVDLVTTLVQLFIPIVSIMIDQAVFRFLLNCRSESDRKTVVSSSFLTLTLSNFFTVIIYLLVSIFIVNYYKIWVLLILIVTSYSNFFLQIARGLKDTKKYAFGSFICSFVTLVLNVLCITALNMGAIGMVFAIFIGNLICCIYLFFRLKIYKYISIKYFNKDSAIKQIKYSIPLIPNQLSLWIMNSSDRLITVFILGVSLNGILAVSHKFPAIFMTIFGIFQLAWHETGVVHYNDPDRDEFFSQTFDRIITLFSSICIGIIAILPLIFNILVKSSFSYAYYNIPIYMVAFLLNVVIGLIGVIYVATKKTVEIAKTTAVAAIINIIINLILIKKIGLYAAAISTFVGYFVALIFRLIDSKKYISIKYNYKRLFALIVLILIYSCLYYLRNNYMSLFGFLILLPILFITNFSLIKEIYFGMSIDKFVSKFKKIIVVFTLLIIILIGFFIYYKMDNGIDIQKDFSGNIIELKPEKTIFLEDLGLSNFTCTGIAYDNQHQSFWIADYGEISEQGNENIRLIEIDQQFSQVLSVIDLDMLFAKNDVNLQGISINNNNNTIYLSIGKFIYIIDKSGNYINKKSFEEYDPLLTNGIAYNNTDSTIWVLMNKKYLMKYNKNWEVLSKYKFNYKNQDHIFIDEETNKIFFSIGADYSNNNNFILSLNLDKLDNAVLYKTIDSYAIEGITIVDDKIYVVNDGLYHSAKIKKSYINIYNLVD